ncbi:MAG: bifunctional nicotinamidase/pyrazinamidase [Candidatus Helarchaeota archaeon]
MKISEVKLETNIELSSSDVLIIVDIQNDFLPGGALAVANGDEIIETVNKISAIFHKRNLKIVLTQDWHPPHHASFASNHPGKEPFEEFSAEGIGPILWPDHCIQGKKGAEFSSLLNTETADAIIRKGVHPEVDSYSAFLENDKKTETGLAGYLKSLNIKRIFLCGLALDYCVYFSAMDAKKMGFEVYVILDLTKGIDDPPESIATSLETMTKEGIKFVKSEVFL